MKLIVFSDLHIHNYKQFDKDGSRLNNSLAVLVDIFKLAHRNKASHILFAGDLFHRQKALPTEVITKTIQIFDELFLTFPDIKLLAISGNHDHASKNLPDQEAISALEFLNYLFPNFYLIDNSYWALGNKTRVFGIPYYTHEAHFKSALEAISEQAVGNYTNILLIHQTPLHSNPMISHEVVPEDTDLFDYTFCGHIHEHEQLSDKFVIVGNPIQQNLGDAGYQKGVLIFDTETMSFEKVDLDYPVFEVTNTPADDNVYAVPKVEEFEEGDIDIKLSDTHAELLKDYLEAAGKHLDDYYETGLSLIK